MTVVDTRIADQPRYDCRDAYVETLAKLAEADHRIVGVVNDSVGSSKLNSFRKAFPDRLIAAALHPLTAGVKLDLPLSELRSQSHVLTVATDRKGQLILVDNCLNRLRRRIAENASHARGSKRQFRARFLAWRKRKAKQ